MLAGRKYDIPTAGYETFDSPADAKAFITQCGAPIVVKTSGLAAGTLACRAVHAVLCCACVHVAACCRRCLAGARAGFCSSRRLHGGCSPPPTLLAAGKGVIVAQTLEEAYQAVDDMMVNNAFGSAGEGGCERVAGWAAGCSCGVRTTILKQ